MTTETDLITMASNQDVFNIGIGDTRMVYCNLSELCSKNKLQYKEFLKDLQWEVIENAKPSFKSVDLDDQKIIVSKLIKALDDPDEPFIESSTTELNLLFAQYGITQNIEDLKLYAEAKIKLAIAYFEEHIDNTMNIMRDEYLAERFNDYESRWDYDSSFDRALVRL